ncbi:MAG: hypothetical protein Q7S99_09720 [Parvibaculum sp.]|nr:hypothetical protein [Parvibaculum sp.]|tara:strand:+ start:1311 stop:1568 length:258 start_codon:yes stop_codon:yes gene_type:complete
MPLHRFWRYLTGHRRRVSFYDSEVMREATKFASPSSMAWFTDEVLQGIVENEPHTLRSEIAHHELEMRAVRRRQEEANATHPLPH